MKILYLHQYFNKPSMPGSTRSYEMAKRLVAKGHQVTIITTSRNSDQNEFLREEHYEGIKILWLSVPYGNHFGVLKRIQAFLAFALRAAWLGRKEEFDIIFATSTPLTIGLPALFLKHFCKRPMVFEVRDLWPEMPVAVGVIRNPILISCLKLFEKRVYHSSERIVALSPGMKAGVVKTGVPEQRVAVIPNASDLDRFSVSKEQAITKRSELGYSEEDIVLGYFGTFGSINDVDFLVRVAGNLDQKIKLKVLLCGGGATYQRTSELAEKLGVLGSTVKIMGSVPKDEIPELYGAVDIGASVFLPIKEMESNSANKFFDSLASGRCTIINYGGWQKELLDEYGAGFHISSDPKKAALELGQYIENEDLDKIGSKARLLAEELFSRDKLAEELEQLLLDVYDSAG